MGPIKVLVVDDSALVRRSLKALLERDPEIKVIATAGDPYIAVQKIQKEKPDVITLDIEMPKMDGLTFLTKIMRQAPMPVVVISNQTVKGAGTALKALEYGAVDVMAKPNLATVDLQSESMISLIDKVRSAYHAGRRTNRISREAFSSKPDKKKNLERPVSISKFTFDRNAIIAVGASTGGTEAIRQFLEVLPPSMPPILIVQHMPEKFTASFAKRLDEQCALKVKEAENLEKVSPNTVYIAPGNYHMSIFNDVGTKVIKIHHGELVNRHRPSVNVLFNSMAEIVGKNTVGILLTGMGDDGAVGLLAMHRKGAFTVAQDEETSVVYGMPFKALKAGGVSRQLPLDQIAFVVCDFLKKETTIDA